MNPKVADILDDPMEPMLQLQAEWVRRASRQAERKRHARFRRARKHKGNELFELVQLCSNYEPEGWAETDRLVYERACKAVGRQP